MENKYAPIVLFVYNRPDHTKCVVEGLLSNPEAKDSDLFIFSDGPKVTANESDIEKIEACRIYIKSICGFRSIQIEESFENKGLANATIYGCTKVISKLGKMIMMEDDDVPNEFFLSYVNEALNRYENDERIWSVSGYTDTSILLPRGDVDLFCVTRPSSWGFGTWKRSWQKVIWDINMLKGLFTHQSIITAFDKWSGLDSSSMMFDLFEGKNSSWSIRFNFSAFLNQAVNLLPQKSLIYNIGFDGSGTHCGTFEVHLQMLDRPVTFSDNVSVDPIRNAQLLKSVAPKTSRERVKHFVNTHLFLRKYIHLSK